MMNNFFYELQGFLNNPKSYLLNTKLGITEEMLQDPQKAIQELMNEGKISQAQYNQAVQQANQLKNNPKFQQFFHNR